MQQNRFTIYRLLKSNLDSISNVTVADRIDTMISPLYLYAILCNDNAIQKKFADLSLREKIASAPKKLISKIQDRKMQQRLHAAVSQNAKSKDLQNRVLFYPVEPTHLRQMLPVSACMPKGTFLYITDRLAIHEDLKAQGIESYMIPRVAATESYDFDYALLGKGLISNEQMNDWKSYCSLQINTRLSGIEKSLAPLITQLKPSGLVVGYDITPEGRYCVKLAQEMGIPTYCIQHGSISGEPLDGEHIVKSYLLYGEQAKEYLEGIGNKSASLKVFGAPYLDKELFESEIDKATLKMLGLNEKQETLLVALSGPGHCTTMDHFNEIVVNLVLFAKNHPSINLIFKLHRKDSIQNYNRIFKELGYSCPLIDSQDQRFPTDIFYWLNNTDVLITGSSTVALEAMLKSKPVITIDYQNQYQNIDFIEMDCTYHIDKKEQLEETILKVLATRLSEEKDQVQTNAKNYADRYFYSESKPASERIAAWLLSN
jgi:hypothetical protein